MPRLTLRRVIFTFLALFLLSFYFYSISAFFDNKKLKDEISANPTGRKIFQRLPEFSGARLQFHEIDKKAYVLTAFTDDRDGNMGYRFVRVLVAIDKPKDFDCYLNGMKSPEVNFYEFSENHGARMQTFIISCRVPDEFQFDDIETVLVNRLNSRKSVEVPISYRIANEETERKNKKPVKMSICVPVLFPGFYEAERLVEFVELNVLQGIEKIFLYYDPEALTNERINRTLQYYADNHVVQLIEFKLPSANFDIWYHGQLLTITDCLLRNTGLSKFTFFHDIDEFFVPMSNISLYETLSKLFENPLVGSKRTALKYISIKDKNVPITNNVVSERRLETRLTKCVVRPEMVFEQGIHHTSRVIMDKYILNDHDGSLLRVYHFKPPSFCCQNEVALRDKYSVALSRQLKYVIQLLNLN